MPLSPPTRILIMEDDPGEARLAQQALVHAGFAVDVVHDGESGLARLRATPYDVVIVDHEMPGKDGLQVLHTLVAWNALSPTVMVTGHGNEAVAVEAMKQGASDYIVKDVEGNYLSLLPAVIERLLIQQRLVTEKHLAEETLQATLQELEERVQARTADLRRTNTRLREEIVERMRMEHALRQSEAQNRSIVETAVDGIITIDQLGCIETFNSAAERIFGYTAQEVIGRNVSMLMPFQYADEHDGYLARYLRTREPRIIGSGREVMGRRKDGSTFPMDLAVGETQADNRLVFTGIVRDITERKRAVQELQHADRLALVGQLASGLAHEIGTPLNVIAGNAELLKMDLLAQNVPTDLVDTIVRQTDRITGLIQQLLTFASADNQTMGLFSLHDPLAHTLRLLEARLTREGITTTVDIPVDLPLLWGIADQIEQVFLNILVNAWHAMPEGGVLTITAQPLGKTQVRITFRDTGKGMTPENMAKACEPFYSTKGEQGTGLGLAICKQIIEQHQGNLQLESTLGSGTTVIVDLPRADVTT